MIDERLMAPGSWELTLKPDTPALVRTRLCAGWYPEIDNTGANIIGDLVAITPTRLPATGLTYGSVLAKSIYSGVILRSTLTAPGRPATIGGTNLLYYLGDSSRGADIPRGAFTGLTTFPLVLSYLFATDSRSNGLAWSDVGVPTNTISFSWSTTETTWSIIERWRKATNPETQFRLRPDGTVLFAAYTDADLFAQVPAVVLTTTGPFGPAGGMRYVRVDNVEVSWDYLSAAAMVNWVGSGGASGLFNTTDPFGNTFIIESFKDTGGTPNFASMITTVSSSETTLPSNNSLRGYGPRIDIEASGVVGLRMGVDCRVGDMVALYDPWSTGAFPPSALTTLKIHGSEQQALTARISSVRWPVTSAMGVYHLAPFGVNGVRGYPVEPDWMVRDISEFVAFEDENQMSVRLGSPKPRVATPPVYKSREV